MYSMTAQLRLKEELNRADGKRILKKIKRIVGERFDIEHATIEIE